MTLPASFDNLLNPEDPFLCVDCWEEEHPEEDLPLGADPGLCFDHSCERAHEEAEIKSDMRKEEGWEPI